MQLFGKNRESESWNLVNQ
ncbi:hypothetical protein CEXT_40551, partial [Caerostris extrusa]